MKKLFPLFACILVVLVSVFLYESCSNKSNNPISGDDGNQFIVDPNPPKESKWYQAGNTGFSTGIANRPNLVINSSGTPYVSYRNNAIGEKTSVMTLNGETWEHVGATTFSDGNVGYPSLAINNSGTLYIAFSDKAHGSNASVMTYGNGAWSYVGNSGFSPDEISHTAMDIANNGDIYIAFQDTSQGNKATIMKYDGSSWQTVGNPGFSANVVYSICLALDDNDIPYIMFRDTSQGNKATVMKYDGGSWNYVGNPGFSANPVSITYNSLVIDALGTPYVAYQDENKATVMKFNAGSWSYVGDGTGFSAGEIKFPSLALDNNDKLYIAYSDLANGEKATVMKFNGTASVWETVGSIGFSADKATRMSLEINGNNTPYLAFIDHNTQVTVMKYDNLY